MSCLYELQTNFEKSKMDATTKNENISSANSNFYANWIFIDTTNPIILNLLN